MQNGPEYLPSLPQDDREVVYDDVSVWVDDWFIKWVYVASDAGLVDG